MQFLSVKNTETSAQRIITVEREEKPLWQRDEKGVA